MDGRVMDDKPASPVDKNPWDTLRRFTNARIALGRAGSSLPTAPLLAFNLSHAQARDAVHQPLDTAALHDALRAAGFDTLDAASAAPDRDHYLRRPDLGRTLSEESAAALAAHAGCRVRRRRWSFRLRSRTARHAVPRCVAPCSRWLEGRHDRRRDASARRARRRYR
jgi:ethanolamine ammonia-lyase small subunit